MFPATMAAQRDRLVGALRRGSERPPGSDRGPLPAAAGSRPPQVRGDRRALPLRRCLAARHARALPRRRGGPELAADWAAAYGLVAQVMTEAAGESEQLTPAWWDAEVVGHERRGPHRRRHGAHRAAPPLPPWPVRVGPVALTPRMWRYLLPANAPRGDNTLEFHVRAVDGGWVSPSLVHATARVTCSASVPRWERPSPRRVHRRRPAAAGRRHGAGTAASLGGAARRPAPAAERRPLRRRPLRGRAHDLPALRHSKTVPPADGRPGGRAR